MKSNTPQMRQIQPITNGFLGVVSRTNRVSHMLVLISAVLFTVTSCKEESTDPLTIDMSYYPLEAGRYIIYDVDSTGYSSFDGSIITSSYQIMEELDSPFIDNEGNEAFRIIRSRRESESSAWRVTDIWTTNLTDHTAEKVEENLRFIKLDFPVNLHRRWYGNAKIQADSSLEWLNGWVYEYTSVHEPLAINGNTFDSTLTVVQHDEQNLIEQVIYIEQYAAGVGLIYKKEQQTETQPGFPTDGFLIEMRVNEYN
jgi:hypothetical protein